jgi:hypothetical protein
MNIDRGPPHSAGASVGDGAVVTVGSGVKVTADAGDGVGVITDGANSVVAAHPRIMGSIKPHKANTWNHRWGLILEENMRRIQTVLGRKEYTIYTTDNAFHLFPGSPAKTCMVDFGCKREDFGEPVSD